MASKRGRPCRKPAALVMDVEPREKRVKIVPVDDHTDLTVVQGTQEEPTAKSGSEDAVKPSSDPKRRGRTKKTSDSQPVSVPDSREDTVKPTSLRKRRGRPKKMSVSQHVSFPDSTEGTVKPTSLRKKRGRPEEISDSQPVSVPDSQEDTVRPSSVLRRRGRPKKLLDSQPVSVPDTPQDAGAQKEPELPSTSSLSKAGRGMPRDGSKGLIRSEPAAFDAPSASETGPGGQTCASPRAKAGRGRPRGGRGGVTHLKTEDTASASETGPGKQTDSELDSAPAKKLWESTTEGQTGWKGTVNGQELKSVDSDLPEAKTEPADDKNNTPTTSKEQGADRVVVVKGKAAVDALCPITKHCHVYEEGDDVWDCMLNQTNIQYNNNKFYLIQLLEDDSKPSYSVWMRWGRVGASGQSSLQPCGTDLTTAKKIFTKKFSDKTRNVWERRQNFQKVDGKYDLIALDYTSSEDTPDAMAANEVCQRQKRECTLEARVRALIEQICDVRTMEEAVVQMKYDAKRAPLGKLTVEQINAGYQALKTLEELVESVNCSKRDLVKASNDFYTRIPHYFGMKVPPVIRTKDDIQAKMALLEVLGDIQVALSVLGHASGLSVHPVDQKYLSLKIKITPMEKNNPDFKIIENYMKTTHAKTHTLYTLELLEAFACYKESEHSQFKNVGNCTLLWHGSRTSNMAGILSTGLRIAPPEAPSTGFMFGKGIYFADMSSKSANYCWASVTNDVGFLLLCEVALGQSRKLYNADYHANKLPVGFNSVQGCGRTTLLPENYKQLSDGTVVPMGPGVQMPCTNRTEYSLLYNEYIVYDPAQVLTRFLLKVKFSFK